MTGIAWGCTADAGTHLAQVRLAIPFDHLGSDTATVQTRVDRLERASAAVAAGKSFAPQRHHRTNTAPPLHFTTKLPYYHYHYYHYYHTTTRPHD